MTPARVRWMVVVLAGGVLLSGCGGGWAYRQGQAEAKKGNWDLAVARLTRALDQDPDHIGIKIALDNARREASREHHEKAKQHMAAEELDQAQDELEIASKFDSANRAVAEDVTYLRLRVERRDEERRAREELASGPPRSRPLRVPTPVLSPRSPAPINMKFTDTSLQKILEALGKLAGVNMLFDQDFRDKKYSFNVSGVTFEAALERLTFLNRLFYKVVDENTLVIVPESPQKRRSYDDQFVQTFYLRNAETKEMVPIVKGITGIQKVVENASLGAITVTGTLDQLAFGERIITNNDKPRGEVLIELKILEVSRTKAREFGINFSNYAGGVTFAPFGEPDRSTTATGLVDVRAHMLSSLSLADFVVSLPASVFARFLESDSTGRILAAPRLRASEGKKTSFKVGTEIAIPNASFTGTGQVSSGTTTSFTTRNVGVNLELTPKINAGGEITLEIAAEFSDVGQSRPIGTGENALIIPEILTRNVSGILRLRDGETSLIGGLMRSTSGTSASGPLGISRIPLIGKLFGARTSRSEDTEVLMSITPRIVRGPRVTAEDLEPLYVGTTELPRVPSARPPLFGLAEPEKPAEPKPAETKPAPDAKPAAAAEPAEGKPRKGGDKQPGSATPPAASPAPPSAPQAAPAPPTPPSSPAPPAGAKPGPEPPPAAPAAALDLPVAPGVPSETTPQPAPAASPGAPAGPGMQARFAPADSTLSVGAPGALSIILVNARDVLSLEVVLAYDPSVIEVVDLGPGALLSLDGSTLGVERQLDRGRARARFTRPRPGSGSGAVALLTFKGVREGASPVLIEALTVATPAGPVSVAAGDQGRVTVKP